MAQKIRKKMLNDKIGKVTELIGEIYEELKSLDLKDTSLTHMERIVMIGKR